MRINLCRRKIRMPEQFLNGAQIGPSCEQVRRKRVAQRVHFCVNAAFRFIPAKSLPQTFSRKRIAAVIDENFGDRFFPDKKRPRLGKVCGKFFLRRISEGHDALFITLTSHEDNAFVQMHVLHEKRSRFARAKPARIDEFEKRRIAKSQGLRRIDGRKEGFDLRNGKDARQRTGGFRTVEREGKILAPYTEPREIRSESAQR